MTFYYICINMSTRCVMQKTDAIYYNGYEFYIPNKLTATEFATIREHLGLSQIKMAQVLELSQSMVNKYESSAREISKNTVAKLRSYIQELKSQSEATSKPINMDYYPDVYLSSSFNKSLLNNPASHVQFDTLLINRRDNLEINPNSCVVILINGDSLSPVYEHGDRVILDTSFKRLIDGYLYVLLYKDECYVRQVFKTPERIKCVALNEKYDTFYLNGDYEVCGLIVPRIRL